ncbi:unnamed protein product [Rotaria sp. Silwood2]|nr:unnamed protein product [Rotaria sp. Silwood2]CAF2644393.1 unnamed protein product [Rotaria sp. Silwood2]CAF3071263.1 unnamed protein product [Rotaria sp. Silwood2]CAF3909571.1 unnamed protein product [Rotaria sp. Silwood2]CAF4029977.1 unnamed protein product [Rotaria sp. Silwood2]
MESNQVQTYPITQAEQSDDKEKVVLRALVGDPNRHRPLAQHPSPTTSKSQNAIPASMYTLETRYRSIPSKVLPKSTEATFYYIEPKQVEQTSPRSVPLSKEERETSQPFESEGLNAVEEEKESQATAFLEPKIISQPVLYSIVATKSPSVQNDQPIPANQDVDSPILYTITGKSNLPNIDMSGNNSNIETPVVNKSANFYSLVGNPRVSAQPQEPISKTLQQPLPNLYSIVGSPTLSPNMLQANTYDSTTSTQPVKTNSVQPEPILYTVVDEKQKPTNIPKENRPPPTAPIKKQAKEAVLYTVIGDPSMPQSMTPARKTQPLKPQALPQQIQTPTLYPLIGKPNPPLMTKMNIRPKPSVLKKTSSSTELRTRRTNQSLERQVAPEAVIEEITSISDTKHKRQTKSQELTIQKSETIFIPLPERQHVSRSKQLRTTPRNISPGQINHKPSRIPRYDPFYSSDYISPYLYHPSKPYRERKYNPKLLPVITNNSSERKTRPLIHESRHRVEQKHPCDPRMPHSLERYPINTKQHPRVWDFEEHAQTDGDDDMNEATLNRRKEFYRRIRPRTPWVPVW